LRRSENSRDGAIVAFPTGGTPLNAQVLVLNQNYEPLNICNAKRALVMVITGKAEILELDGLVLHTIDQGYRAPSVIRLATLIKRPRPQVKLTRREVFIRDNFTCQYCGRQTRELTIDHVIPKSRHGAHTWENLVSACKECNHRKGGKTVQEARMRLLHEPYRPRAGAYYTIQRKISHDLREEWLKFIPGFEPLSSPSSTLVYGGND
jgi:5-methylcytosine-specific restriction endonuclease McrA